MKERGRPIEIKRETSQGRVGAVIYKLQEIGDFGKTIRFIAQQSRCSPAAVKNTLYWRGYINAKRGPEGQVWKVVSKLRADGEFDKTDIEIARRSGLPRRTVRETTSWRLYDQIKNSSEFRQSISQGSHRRRRQTENSVTGRVIQFIRKALKQNDFSLSVTDIAGEIQCSRSAVAKTRAWRDYVIARDL